MFYQSNQIQKKQTQNKIPISLVTTSYVTRLEEKNKSKFEIEYDLKDLIPNVEYKILKLQGQDLEIPFGEKQYKLKLAQSSGTSQTNASATEKTFKTTFSVLSPESIILTQKQRTPSGGQSGSEYLPETLDLNLDPVSMWSLDKKKIMVKFKPVGPDGKDLTSGDNNKERNYEFNVNMIKLKITCC
ncbi:hypothetical protein [Mycoplasma sp. 'Moose RK']|uniref:hypothetical protein n=1 Tax=Mycoplasma sp. 'Moose RK' TaxID=2780095 RepID=UPI0018C290CC|nr:hypothetical protein [Mycoplasma sp. 'Moose RK']MBG0731055.1 hypothetical protein [Mycoplasma sp. 'Moose RK']